MRDPGFRESEDVDSTVAITDVDCTPRPRWRETPEQFADRLNKLEAQAVALSASSGKRNRTDALRWSVDGEGVKSYFTRCACGWCGLRVADPEVARREYDKHDCAIDKEEIGVRLHRKEPLPANWVEETKAMLDQGQLERSLETLSPPVEYASSKPVSTEVVDETAARMSLLELK